MSRSFTKRGWLLFFAMAAIWGIPYLLIKIAVDSYSPGAIVAGRTLIGAAILLPFAIRSGALRVALKHWKWVLAFGLVEMAGPFFLLGHAEQSLPSGLTGLLVATVPLWATIIALLSGERGALRPTRVAGLVLGFIGVAVIVLVPGLGVSGGGDWLLAAGEVLLVAVMYAIAPFIVARKLNEVPSLGSITLSLLMIGIAYLPIAFMTQHELPTTEATISLVLLGVICTAIAFILFFALIKEVGPVNAPLFTYINPIVALVAGVIILSEHLGVELLIGAPIVLLGCWLAAMGGKKKEAVLPEPDPTPLG